MVWACLGHLGRHLVGQPSDKMKILWSVRGSLAHRQMRGLKPGDSDWSHSSITDCVALGKLTSPGLSFSLFFKIMFS